MQGLLVLSEVELALGQKTALFSISGSPTGTTLLISKCTRSSSRRRRLRKSRRVCEMKLLRRIITVNLSVGAVGFLLTMGQYHWDRSQILTHLARSLTVPFFVGTPVVLVLMRYGPNMYRRRVPINWLLISATILACAASGMLLFSLC